MDQNIDFYKVYHSCITQKNVIKVFYKLYMTTPRKVLFIDACLLKA